MRRSSRSGLAVVLFHILLCIKRPIHQFIQMGKFVISTSLRQ